MILGRKKEAGQHDTHSSCIQFLEFLLFKLCLHRVKRDSVIGKCHKILIRASPAGEAYAVGSGIIHDIGENLLTGENDIPSSSSYSL